MRRPVQLALLVIAVVLTAVAAASPASAAPRKVVSGVAIGDVPRLSGDQVVYEQPSGSAGKLLIRRAAPGGTPVEVTTGLNRDVCDSDEDAQCDSDYFRFDSSATRVAFEQFAVRDRSSGPPSFTLSSGPFTGPFDALVSCNAKGGALARFGYGFSLDGDAIAYQTDSCVPATTGVNIVVRDLGPAAPPPRVIPSDVDTAFKLAGNYLALRKDKKLTVLDRTTGATLYTLTAPNPVFDFDVQADGKLAVSSGNGQGCSGNLSIFWASSAAPTLHDVGCGFGDVHIADDRIVFFRQVRGKNASQQIVSSDFDGNLQVVAAIVGSGFISEGATLAGDEFDLQGSRVAYAVQDCIGDSVWTQDLPAGPSVPQQKVSCPVTFGPKTAKVSKKGKVSIPVTCPNGCEASLSGAVLGKGNTIAIRVLPATDVLITKGTRKIGFKLTKAGLKALRKKGKLSVSLNFFGPPILEDRALTLKLG
jgi:hypothetical protein